MNKFIRYYDLYNYKMANHTELIITLPNGKCISKIFDCKKTIRAILRFVRYEMGCETTIPLYTPQLRNLSPKDKITDHFKNLSSIQFSWKMVETNLCNTDNIDVQIDIEGPHFGKIIRIRMSPNNRVLNLLRYVLEILDNQENIDLITSDVEMVHNEQILYPTDELALHPEIARTYILFFPILDMKKGITSQILANDMYYSYKTIGPELTEVPLLTLRLKTKDLGPKIHACGICKKDAYIRHPITLPQCRHVFCKECIDNHVIQGNYHCYSCNH